MQATPKSIKLYDTYLKQHFILTPNQAVVPNTIKMYSCGPTVYNYQSIGNMRAVWLPDTVVKVAKIAGWQTEWTLNITDVGHLVGDGDQGEDKVEKMAQASGNTIDYIVNHYTEDYKNQCQALNFDLPKGKYNPKATEYIAEQMELAIDLLERKLAYVVEDGVYFDYASFVAQGKSAKLPQSIQKMLDNQGNSGDFTDRNIKNTYKDPRDFAIWKFVTVDTLQKWKFEDYPELASRLNSLKLEDIVTKWGCPGWHSECVAMICKTLNGYFPPQLTAKKSAIDLHFGGEDHIDIHHKNEVLQACALDFELSTHWIHNKFVMVEGAKMSKSLGNVYTVIGKSNETGFESIVERGFDPLAYRLMLFEHSYNQQMNFTWDKLEQSQARLYNLRKNVALVRSFSEANHLPEHIVIDDKQIQVLLKYLLDNLDTPKFLEKFSEFLSECINHILKNNELDPRNFAAIKFWEDNLLRLNLLPDISGEISSKVQSRIEAKKNKDFETADHLRDEIKKLGFEIEDYAWGTGLWKRK